MIELSKYGPWTVIAGGSEGVGAGNAATAAANSAPGRPVVVLGAHKRILSLIRRRS